MRQGLQNRDSTKTLFERLDKIPMGLEKFLDYMLGSIDPIYHSQSSLIFSLAVTASQISTELDLPLLRYSFLEDLRSNANFALEVGPLSEDELEARLERMRFQLDACCKGLLEARRTRTGGPWIEERVTFLHRSVLEYLEDDAGSITGEVPRRLKRTIMGKVGDSETLGLFCHTYLAQVRVVGPVHDRDTDIIDVGDVIGALHRQNIKSQRLDVDCLDALDTVFKQLVSGEIIDFSSRYCSYDDDCSVYKVNQPDSTRVPDVVGTFAFRGYAEILPTNGDASSVHGRSPDHLLTSVLLGFHRYQGLRNNQEYLNLIKRLLQNNHTDINRIVLWSDTISTSSWEVFLQNMARRPTPGTDDEVWDVLTLLLQLGSADPYLWMRLEAEPSAWYRDAERSLILGNAVSSPPTNYRAMVEARPISPKAEALLALLPSHEQYAREWERCRIVSVLEAWKIRISAEKLATHEGPHENPSSVLGGSRGTREIEAPPEDHPRDAECPVLPDGAASRLSRPPTPLGPPAVVHGDTKPDETGGAGTESTESRESGAVLQSRVPALSKPTQSECQPRTLWARTLLLVRHPVFAFVIGTVLTPENSPVVTS